jgi:hypothetical protein
MAQDCLRVKWCYPAGWSADLFVQHKEGIHWHEYLCGWDSKEALMAAVAVATACGLALPPVAFMTWPTNQPASCGLWPWPGHLVRVGGDHLVDAPRWRRCR